MSKVLKHGENLKSVVSGATLVTTYARAIIEQEEINKIKEIPKLPDHQKAAKQQSHTWLNDIWPLIIKTTADIIDYANTYQSTYDQLLTLIPRLEAGDKKAVGDFKKILEYLLKNLNEKKQSVSTTTSNITDFYGKFEPLFNEFSDDHKAASLVMTQDRKDVSELQAQITTLNSEAQLCGFGAIGSVVAGVGTASFMIYTAATSGMGPVGLVVGAICLLIEVGGLIASLTEYINKMDQISDLTGQLNAKNTELTALTTIFNQVNNLQNYTGNINTYASQVQDGWQALEEDIQEVIQKLDTITPEQSADIIKIELNTANKDWGEVLTQAKKLQPSGGQLVSKKFDSAKDYIKDLKEKIKGA